MWGYLFGIYGTMTEPSQWSINDIALPIGPDGIQRQGGCNKEVMSQTQEEPVQVHCLSRLGSRRVLCAQRLHRWLDLGQNRGLASWLRSQPRVSHLPP